MVSWSASAKLLHELVDESSRARAEIVRNAARSHASRQVDGLEGESSILNGPDMVYVCPPAWGLSPREFAATCFYASQEGWTWREWTGTSLMGSASLMAFDLIPGAVGGLVFVGGAALPVTTWAQRHAARARLARLHDSDFSQVVEVWMEDVAFDSALRDDLTVADKMKPGDDEGRRRTLADLYLSAGGDSTVAAALPNRGWITRPQKISEHRANRAVMEAAEMYSIHNRLSDLEHVKADDAGFCACSECEADQYDSDHVEHVTETVPPAPKVAATPTTMAGRWIEALVRFEDVESEWEAIVTDPMAALDHSALLDVSLPRTAAFIESFGKAKDLQARHAAHSPANGPEDRADIVEFEDAVRSARSSWTEAKRWADHVGIEWLPEAERETARTARNLLALAMDERTPIEEAVSAAEKAARLLKSIHSVVLPEPAMRQIETRTRRSIG